MRHAADRMANQTGELEIALPAAAGAGVTPTAATIAVAAIGSALVLLTARAEARPVLVPLLAILGIAATALVALYERDRQLPVFDVGAMAILVTSVYSAMPLIGFWLAGLQWTPLSYLPLYILNPGPVEVGRFFMRNVLYLASFTAAYLLFRGKAVIHSGRMRELRPASIAALVLIGSALYGYFAFLRSAYGVSYDPSYSDLSAATESAEALPQVIRQLSHNLFAILFLVKLALLVWLMSRWRDWRWRAVLIVWLTAEGFATVTKMGGRTWYVMLVMAAGLLYHRLVKPLRVVVATAVVALLLTGALVYGVARDVGGGLETVAQAGSSPWATMNEFQALFGIAYELHDRKVAGTLGPVPWQIFANDAIMLVPKQLLPFYKGDPCLGYAAADGSGFGCVLGVISNAVIGLDWLELFLRGLVLGVVFALLHRWYVRRQDGYWTTFFYLCLCLWSYYTFRGSTFYFLYYIVYRFVPLVIAVWALQISLRGLHRSLSAVD